jgi:hypothetical protein
MTGAQEEMMYAVGLQEDWDNGAPAAKRQKNENEE